MKRYLLFSFDYEEASGGWTDFKKSSDTIEELKKYRENTRDYFHEIVDMELEKTILISYANEEWEIPDT